MGKLLGPPITAAAEPLRAAPVEIHELGDLPLRLPHFCCIGSPAPAVALSLQVPLLDEEAITRCVKNLPATKRVEQAAMLNDL